MGRVLVISPEVRFGGLVEHVRCLALGAAALGDEVTMVVPGVRDDIAFPANAEIVCRDLSTRAGVADVRTGIARADAVLLINSPQTGLLIPLLAGARTAAVGVHGSPRTNSAWLGQRTHALVAAACKSMFCRRQGGVAAFWCRAGFRMRNPGCSMRRSKLRI